MKIALDTIKNSGGQTLYVIRHDDGPYKGKMISSLYGQGIFDLPVSWESRESALNTINKFGTHFVIRHLEFGVEFNHGHKVRSD